MEHKCACSMIVQVQLNGVSFSNLHLYKLDGNGNHQLVMDKSLHNSLLTSKLPDILRIISKFIELQTGNSHSTFLSFKHRCTIVFCFLKKVKSVLVSDGPKVISTCNQLLNSPIRTALRLCSRIFVIGPTGQETVLNGLILALMKLILKQSQLPTGNGLNPCQTKTY